MTGSNAIMREQEEIESSMSAADKKPFFLFEPTFWNRIPQALNRFVYEKLRHKAPVLHHEPLHLHIFFPEDGRTDCRYWFGQPKTLQSTLPVAANRKELTLESFKFVFEQVPTIQTVEFSGWGDPLANPNLFEMIQYAHQYNNSLCTVHTPGKLLDLHIVQLLMSPLSKLVVGINGHKPSAYSAITRKNPADFMVIQKNLQNLVHQRLVYGKSSLTIEISIVVDNINYVEMPEMIEFAKNLGVDAVRFDNAVNPLDGERSMQTLYRQNEEVVAFLEELKAKEYPLQVTWPVLLDEDMSEHRNCQDPFTTVSLDPDLNISACSRHLFGNEQGATVWDGNFWNNDRYQWLRGIHSDSAHAVPPQCRKCPNNVGEPEIV